MVKSTPQCRYFSVKPLVCVNCGGRGHLSASCLTKKVWHFLDMLFYFVENIRLCL